MTEEKKQSLHEVSLLLCKTYEALVSAGQVSFSLHDEQINKIDSVVKTVHAGYYGNVRFPTVQEKASAYFVLIIKDHVVTDGNKRLATLWLQTYCDALGIPLEPSIPLDELAVSVESEKELPIFDLIQTIRIILFGVTKK